MYQPQSAGERVDTIDGEGTYTGDTGKWGEHFEVDLDSGGTTYLHYEDIYELQGGETTKPDHV